MTDPQERGWMGEKAVVHFCPETLHPSVPLTTAWKQQPGYSCRQPGWFYCTAIRALKQQPAGSQRQVQIQQIGSGGSKSNLSCTLVKARRALAVCGATGRTSDPFPSHAGVLRGWEAELEIMPLLTSEFKGRFAQ